MPFDRLYTRGSEHRLPEEPVHHPARLQGRRTVRPGNRRVWGGRNGATVHGDLRISPNPYSTSGRFTIRPATLQMIPAAPFNLEVPSFVTVHGFVRCEDKPILAEVVFYPRARSGFPIAPISARSINTGLSEPTTNLAVQLPPGVDFDVRIQPLDVDSAACPPFGTTFPLGTTQPGPGVARFDPEPPVMRTISLRLVEDSSRPAPSPTARDERQVRVVERKTGKVVSPTLRVELVDSLPFPLPVIASELTDAVVQLDLNPALPWTEVLEVEVALPALPEPGTEATAEQPVTSVRVPAIPSRVIFTGAVELQDADGASANPGIPDSELTFKSVFPLTQPVGTTVGVSDLDWCQLPKLSSEPIPVACRSEVTARADGTGTFKVSLLPGKYEVLVAPGPLD